MSSCCRTSALSCVMLRLCGACRGSTNREQLGRVRTVGVKNAHPTPVPLTCLTKRALSLCTRARVTCQREGLDKRPDQAGAPYRRRSAPVIEPSTAISGGLPDCIDVSNGCFQKPGDIDNGHVWPHRVAGGEGSDFCYRNAHYHEQLAAHARPALLAPLAHVHPVIQAFQGARLVVAFFQPEHHRPLAHRCLPVGQVASVAISLHLSLSRSLYRSLARGAVRVSVSVFVCVCAVEQSASVC